MISICMPYYNRQKLLEQSVAAYKKLYLGDTGFMVLNQDAELSIVDDRSDPPLDPSVLEGIPNIVSYIKGSPEPRNPCVPINQSVNQSKGDIIVLTNPEIEHREPVFEEMLDAVLSDDDYAIAACRDAKTGRWLSSSQTRKEFPMPANSGLHFCIMMTRTHWDYVGGFDEEYRDGQAFEDIDFLWRLDEKFTTFVMLDNCVVYHHQTRVKWPAGGHEKNKELFRSKRAWTR